MAKTIMWILDEKPELSLDVSELSFSDDPLLVIGYSGLQLYLSKLGLRYLKYALKDGEVMFQNYQEFIDSANNLPLPF